MNNPILVNFFANNFNFLDSRNHQNKVKRLERKKSAQTENAVSEKPEIEPSSVSGDDKKEENSGSNAKQEN